MISDMSMVNLEASSMGPQGSAKRQSRRSAVAPGGAADDVMIEDDRGAVPGKRRAKTAFAVEALSSNASYQQAKRIAVGSVRPEDIVLDLAQSVQPPQPAQPHATHRPRNAVMPDDNVIDATGRTRSAFTDTTVGASKPVRRIRVQSYQNKTAPVAVVAAPQPDIASAPHASQRTRASKNAVAPAADLTEEPRRVRTAFAATSAPMFDLDAATTVKDAPMPTTETVQTEPATATSTAEAHVEGAGDTAYVRWRPSLSSLHSSYVAVLEQLSRRGSMVGDPRTADASDTPMSYAATARNDDGAELAPHMQQHAVFALLNGGGGQQDQAPDTTQVKSLLSQLIATPSQLSSALTACHELLAVSRVPALRSLFHEGSGLHTLMTFTLQLCDLLGFVVSVDELNASRLARVFDDDGETVDAATDALALSLGVLYNLSFDDGNRLKLAELGIVALAAQITVQSTSGRVLEVC